MSSPFPTQYTSAGNFHQQCNWIVSYFNGMQNHCYCCDWIQLICTARMEHSMAGGWRRHVTSQTEKNYTHNKANGKDNLLQCFPCMAHYILRAFVCEENTACLLITFVECEEFLGEWKQWHWQYELTDTRAFIHDSDICVCSCFGRNNTSRQEWNVFQITETQRTPLTRLMKELSTSIIFILTNYEAMWWRKFVSKVCDVRLLSCERWKSKSLLIADERSCLCATIHISVLSTVSIVLIFLAMVQIYCFRP